MTREYHLPSGELVPPELQEKIADDVRAFDAAQTPEARTAAALRKLSLELPRLRSAVTGGDDDRSPLGRIAVAMEIEALLSMGYNPAQLRSTFRGNELRIRYGLDRFE